LSATRPVLRHSVFCRLKTSSGSVFRFSPHRRNTFSRKKFPAVFPCKTVVKISRNGTLFAALIQAKIIFKSGIALANGGGVG
jgi:hypothetical protein